MIEKVNPCHPDKVADRIAGAIVDYAYSMEEKPKVAVEVLIGHGVCHVIMESSVVPPQQAFLIGSPSCRGPLFLSSWLSGKP